MCRKRHRASQRSNFQVSLWLQTMAPPTYGDLGKDARNVFGKGYHFGLIKLDLKTKSSAGVEFATGGSSNIDSGNVSGSLETTYKIKDYGLTFNEKWTTDNVLATGVSIQDHLAKGLKLAFDSTFAPQTGYVCWFDAIFFVNYCFTTPFFVIRRIPFRKRLSNKLTLKPFCTRLWIQTWKYHFKSSYSSSSQFRFNHPIKIF